MKCASSETDEIAPSVVNVKRKEANLVENSPLEQGAQTTPKEQGWAIRPSTTH